ncbi:hypothetical protein ACH42_11510 [Endozoicomonas sp. (ex Bugula neritina AB1)]|nr:hypothetical protein ACH42_11510 [Endozoicomonas sp. (ex Bugula neritina AB1)]
MYATHNTFIKKTIAMAIGSVLACPFGSGTVSAGDLAEVSSSGQTKNSAIKTSDGKTAAITYPKNASPFLDGLASQGFTVTFEAEILCPGEVSVIASLRHESQDEILGKMAFNELSGDAHMKEYLSPGLKNIYTKTASSAVASTEPDDAVTQQSSTTSTTDNSELAKISAQKDDLLVTTSTENELLTFTAKLRDTLNDAKEYLIAPQLTESEIERSVVDTPFTADDQLAFFDTESVLSQDKKHLYVHSDTLAKALCQSIQFFFEPAESGTGIEAEVPDSSVLARISNGKLPVVSVVVKGDETLSETSVKTDVHTITYNAETKSLYSADEAPDPIAMHSVEKLLSDKSSGFTLPQATLDEFLSAIKNLEIQALDKIVEDPNDDDDNITDLRFLQLFRFLSTEFMAGSEESSYTGTDIHTLYAMLKDPLHRSLINQHSAESNDDSGEISQRNQAIVAALKAETTVSEEFNLKDFKDLTDLTDLTDPTQQTQIMRLALKYLLQDEGINPKGIFEQSSKLKESYDRNQQLNNELQEKASEYQKLQGLYDKLVTESSDETSKITGTHQQLRTALITEIQKKDPNFLDTSSDEDIQKTVANTLENLNGQVEALKTKISAEANEYLTKTKTLETKLKGAQNKAIELESALTSANTANQELKESMESLNKEQALKLKTLNERHQHLKHQLLDIIPSDSAHAELTEDSTPEQTYKTVKDYLNTLSQEHSDTTSRMQQQLTETLEKVQALEQELTSTQTLKNELTTVQHRTKIQETKLTQLERNEKVFKKALLDILPPDEAATHLSTESANEEIIQAANDYITRQNTLHLTQIETLEKSLEAERQGFATAQRDLEELKNDMKGIRSEYEEQADTYKVQYEQKIQKYKEAFDKYADMHSDQQLRGQIKSLIQQEQFQKLSQILEIIKNRHQMLLKYKHEGDILPPSAFDQTPEARHFEVLDSLYKKADEHFADNFQHAIKFVNEFLNDQDPEDFFSQVAVLDESVSENVEALPPKHAAYNSLKLLISKDYDEYIKTAHTLTKTLHASPQQITAVIQTLEIGFDFDNYHQLRIIQAILGSEYSDQYSLVQINSVTRLPSSELLENKDQLIGKISSNSRLPIISQHAQSILYHLSDNDFDSLIDTVAALRRFSENPAFPPIDKKQLLLLTPKQGIRQIQHANPLVYPQEFINFIGDNKDLSTANIVIELANIPELDEDLFREYAPLIRGGYSRSEIEDAIRVYRLHPNTYKQRVTQLAKQKSSDLLTHMADHPLSEKVLSISETFPLNEGADPSKMISTLLFLNALSTETEFSDEFLENYERFFIRSNDLTSEMSGEAESVDTINQKTFLRLVQQQVPPSIVKAYAHANIDKTLEEQDLHRLYSDTSEQQKILAKVTTKVLERDANQRASTHIDRTLVILEENLPNPDGIEDPKLREFVEKFKKTGRMEAFAQLRDQFELLEPVTKYKQFLKRSLQLQQNHKTVSELYSSVEKEAPELIKKQSSLLEKAKQLKVSDQELSPAVMAYFNARVDPSLSAIPADESSESTTQEALIADGLSTLKELSENQQAIETLHTPLISNNFDKLRLAAIQLQKHRANSDTWLSYGNKLSEEELSYIEMLSQQSRFKNNGVTTPTSFTQEKDAEHSHPILLLDKEFSDSNQEHQALSYKILQQSQELRLTTADPEHEQHADPSQTRPLQELVENIKKLDTEYVEAEQENNDAIENSEVDSIHKALAAAFDNQPETLNVFQASIEGLEHFMRQPLGKKMPVAALIELKLLHNVDLSDLKTKLTTDIEQYTLTLKTQVSDNRLLEPLLNEVKRGFKEALISLETAIDNPLTAEQIMLQNVRMHFNAVLNIDMDAKILLEADIEKCLDISNTLETKLRRLEMSPEDVLAIFDETIPIESIHSNLMQSLSLSDIAVYRAHNKGKSDSWKKIIQKIVNDSSYTYRHSALKSAGNGLRIMADLYLESLLDQLTYQPTDAYFALIATGIGQKLQDKGVTNEQIERNVIRSLFLLLSSRQGQKGLKLIRPVLMAFQGGRSYYALQAVNLMGPETAHNIINVKGLSVNRWALENLLMSYIRDIADKGLTTKAMGNVLQYWDPIEVLIDAIQDEMDKIVDFQRNGNISQEEAITQLTELHKHKRNLDWSNPNWEQYFNENKHVLSAMISPAQLENMEEKLASTWNARSNKASFDNTVDSVVPYVQPFRPITQASKVNLYHAMAAGALNPITSAHRFLGQMKAIASAVPVAAGATAAGATAAGAAAAGATAAGATAAGATAAGATAAGATAAGATAAGITAARTGFSAAFKYGFGVTKGVTGYMFSTVSKALFSPIAWAGVAYDGIYNDFDSAKWMLDPAANILDEGLGYSFGLKPVIAPAIHAGLNAASLSSPDNIYAPAVQYVAKVIDNAQGYEPKDSSSWTTWTEIYTGMLFGSKTGLVKQAAENAWTQVTNTALDATLGATTYIAETAFSAISAAPGTGTIVTHSFPDFSVGERLVDGAEKTSGGTGTILPIPTISYAGTDSLLGGEYKQVGTGPFEFEFRVDRILLTSKEPTYKESLSKTDSHNNTQTTPPPSNTDGGAPIIIPEPSLGNAHNEGDEDY